MNRLLVVGLGNPGAEYQETRHNLGYMVADRLAERWGAAYRFGGLALESDWVKPRACPGHAVKLLKPTTYMNRSGWAVAEAAKRDRLEPGVILVICDDVNLPFGKLRIRLRGGDGGHNGLASVIEALGTEEFPRLRIGIGANFARGRMVDYVLSQFEPEEQKVLPEILDRAASAVECFICDGPEKAMTLFNG